MATDATELTAPRAHRWPQLALVSVFGLFLIAPLCVSVVDIFGGPDSQHEEARAKTPTLPTSLGGLRWFIGDAKWYFQRRFGLRMWLTTLHSRVKVEALGVSSSDQVALGDGGWLYTTDGKTLEDHRGLVPFTQGQLSQLAGELTARRNRLRARGVPYVVLICPDKQSVYPEFLPKRYRRVHGPTRLQQALAYLGEHTDLQVVDLRPTLRAAKTAARVFHRTDTHWNEVGAYLGVQELIARLRPMLPALAMPTAVVPAVRKQRSHGGDLARQLALQQRMVEHVLVPDLAMAPLTRDGKPFIPFASHDVLSPERVVIDAPDGAPGTVTVLRDSFGIALMPWLSQYFGRTVYRATYDLPAAVLEEDRPALVIQQLVERKLGRLLDTPDGANVFLGDSLIANGSWGELGRPYRNAGVKGDVARGVHRRVVELLGERPAQLFLMVGTNDLGRGHAIADIVSSIDATLTTIAAHSPSTRVVLQSVLPVLPSLMPSLAGRNERIVALNQALERLAAKRGLAYVDLHRSFTDANGELKWELTTDGVHLRPGGYALWYEILREQR